MARYTGPKTKIARKFGEAIFGDDKSFEKRNYPPGQHGNAKRRGKKSEYAIQLMEKQKAKFTYGILERQFRNLFEKASRSKGVTGDALLQLCESRLDNVVYRFGLSPSRSGARQLVSHRHITVNDSIVNIPSYQVKVGDVVGVREKSKSLNISEEEVLEKMKSLVPINRLGKTEEYGYLVSFLSSDKASYINGASIPIDGGLLRSY